MKPLKLNIQFFADDHTIGVDFRVNVDEAKKELKKLEKEVKANEHAWKRFTVETEDWDKSAEGLRDGVDKLTKKQESQTKVVENLKKQYELVKDRLGENDQWTANLNERYEKARLELAKTNDELKDYQKKLDNSTDETKDLEKASDDLNGKFTILKGTVSQLIADGIKKLATTTFEAAKQVVDMGISFESAFAGEIILRPSC